jgi:hypothetical protein
VIAAILAEAHSGTVIDVVAAQLRAAEAVSSRLSSLALADER